MKSAADAAGGPVIVSFVSGKGGVGKTMLAAAFAKEISAATPTLVVDLDFFNRGLTGLIGSVSVVHPVAAPEFISFPAGGQAAAWGVAPIGDNLFFLAYPELTPADLENFATLDVGVLRESIRRVVTAAATACGCRCIVIDCHGGPDNSSFAACQISHHSILVSEPDKITFFGTLHFIRQLTRLSRDAVCDLRLVFNKVVPAFSARYLTRVYNRSIRQYFNDQPLLAIFPLEIYLTREFERTTFLTKLFPHSQLARRTHLLLYDLFERTRRDVLPRSVASLPLTFRAFRRWYLHPPAVLNLEFVLRLVGVGALVVAGILFLDDYFLRPGREELATAAAQLDAIRFIETNPDVFARLEEPVRRQLEELAKTGRSDLLLDWYPGAGYSSYDGTAVDAAPEASADVIWARYRVDAFASELQRRYSNAADPTADELVGWIDELRAYDFQDAEKYSSAATEQARREVLQEGSTMELRAIRAMLALRRLVGLLAPIAIVWPVAVLLLSWSSDVDRTFTRLDREGRRLRSLARALVAVMLWAVPLGGLMAVSMQLAGRGDERIFGLLVASAATVMGVAVLDQAAKAYRNGWLERRRVDAVVRVAFVAYLVAGAGGIAYATREARQGNYVEQLATPFTDPPPADEVAELSVDAAPAEETFPDGGRPAWFLFSADQGGYVIDAQSVGDPFIRVYDANGFRFLSDDDDGGEGLDSRLIIALDAGEYYLEVRNLSAQSDPFTVTIRSVDAAMPLAP